MAFVDLWTITPENVTPKIYTLEIVKLERVSISFSIFGQNFSFPESSTVDTSVTSPSYWMAQIKETGEIGEFL